jgi:FtsP/CotA-like multicopper oxidase with cupredoxin domain
MRLSTSFVGIGFLVLTVAVGAGWTIGAEPGLQSVPTIDWNDNRERAGTMSEGRLDLDLEIVEGDWHVLGPEQPAGRVLAFAERGGAPSIPGPFVRVPLGTEISASITNPTEHTIVVRGLGSRREEGAAPLEIEAGATREWRFSADVAGTYYYYGSIDGASLGQRFFEDSQLTGAFVIDEPGARTDDDVLLMGMWYDGREPDGGPDIGREFLVINGRPWPHTERYEYALGDTVRWRIINTSSSPHAMHLHGFYYRIDARGDIARDTVYWDREQRMAVTERTATGSTMTMVWVPDRPGGWIFHCHMSEHVIPNPTMGADHLSEEERMEPLFTEGHHEENPDMHAVEGMGGLVIGTYIRPPEGWVPDEPKRREMRLYIQSAPAEGGLSGRQFAYVLQEGPEPPAPDSVVFPGSPLVLQQGEPTSIKVFNRTEEHSQVHWHGLEIESYFDGVAGFGGYPNRLTPAIAPGDSFEIRITPPRAGSFMYHTHVNDLRQQGSGLYGPFIVLEEGETWDPEHDRIFIYGDSPFREDGVPAVNGGNPPEPIELRVGETYRFRILQITLGRPNTRLRLLRDGFPEVWIPVAKDGHDLPADQRRPERADRVVAVGETYDYEYRPSRPGELELDFRTGNGGRLVTQLIRVRE